MKSPALKYTIIALATLGLLYLAFRGQDIGKAMSDIGDARWLPLVGGLLIMFLSHAVRAVRWRIVLRPLKRRTSFWLAFKATIAGYAMNNLIPRSGELVRPYMMARGEKIPMAGTLASVVVERVADVIALSALIIFSLVSYQSRVTNVFPMFTGSVLIGLAAMLGVLLFIMLLFFSERRTKQLVSILTKPLPQKISTKIERIALDFSLGLRGLDRSAILPLIIGTIGIWLMYGISMFVSLQAFPDPAMMQLTLKDAFLLLTLSGIAFTIPTPGGTGSYHALIGTGLSMIFGVPPAIALAYAVATHALSYISITLIGLVFLVGEGLSFGTARNMKPDEELESSTANLSTSSGQALHPLSFIPHPFPEGPHPSPEAHG
jgi:uncharacterized protein (TIRG00374 family)